MPVFSISLASVEDVKGFVAAAAQLACEVDACGGRYVVNAKSIMGLFSMDLARPISIVVHGSEAEGEALRAACRAYLVEG